MFFQYAVWGVWVVAIPLYLVESPEFGGLGFSGGQIGWIVGLAWPVGALAAPFIAGQLADRVVSAKKLLIALLLVTAAAQLGCALASGFAMFLALSICASLAFLPTIVLTNGLTVGSVADARKDYMLARMCGVGGWIAAAGGFSLVWMGAWEFDVPLRIEDLRIERIRYALYASAGLCLVHAIVSAITLPAAKPSRDADYRRAWLRAVALLTHPGFMIAMVIGVVLATILATAQIRLNPMMLNALRGQSPRSGATLTTVFLSDWTMLITLALLALALVRLGFKWPLIVGTMATLVGFITMAAPKVSGLDVLGQALLGVAAVCYFATCVVYVDRIAPVDLRYSAQAMFTALMMGVAPALAVGLHTYAVSVADRVKTEGAFWWVGAAGGILITLILVVLYRPQLRRPAFYDLTAAEPTTPDTPHTPQ